MPRAINRARPRSARPQRYGIRGTRPAPSAQNTFNNTAIVGITDSSGETETNALDVEFDQPVSLTGTPGFVFADGGVERPITAVALVQPNVVRFGFGAAVTGTDGLTVPENDPAIRTVSGGWVNAGSTVIALA